MKTSHTRFDYLCQIDQPSFQADSPMCFFPPPAPAGCCCSLIKSNLTSLSHSSDYWSGVHHGMTSKQFFLCCRMFFCPWALPLSSFDLCSRVHARLLATNTSNRHSLVNMDSPFCRWYSCMLGKKCSLAPLKEELRKQGVSSQRDPEQREIYEYMRKHGNQWELQSRHSFDLSLFVQRHDASCRAC